jgi:hypothetical protein
VTVPQQKAQSKIQTALVTRANLTILVWANGTVQPESSVNVSPKTSGVLKQLLVKEGEFVRSGLTMLGVIIGISSVIAITSIGQ